MRGGEDWVQLFNGKDLTGWNKVGQEKWTVEPGGILHGVAVTKGYGYLQTDKNYKDFLLALHFKCEGDGNSGLFFHTDFKPGTADVSQGLQFEIDCGMMNHTGGIYGDGRNWIVWPAPENETVVRRGEWNEYVLEVRGNRYISRLNGVRDGGLHRPAAAVLRRHPRAAAALGRHRRHEVPRDSGSATSRSGPRRQESRKSGRQEACPLFLPSCV